ncbi:MAG: AI-2E family transporter [Planctomycetes bacterium]|nr:AI-2E family transporter [Planctomycetota bacterium]
MTSWNASKSWITFAGYLAVVAVLYAAQEVVVPVILAALLAFVLSPLVAWFERRLGRVTAVLAVVLVVFGALGLAAWGLTIQLNGLLVDLPRYRVNLVAKLAELRDASQTNAVDQLTRTIEEVQDDLATTEELPPGGSPLLVLSKDVRGFSIFSWLGPLFGLAGACGVVIVLLIFMLLERRDLRDRLIKVVGRGHLALTTKALTEAGDRVARQLLVQTGVNCIFGVGLGLGLLLLHVPYPLLWAALGAALRFIPYAGPLLGAGGPILISVAAMDGWTGPLLVLGLVIVLELFTNLVLETVLYAGAMGVTQVGLLVSLMFWTWLWGPLGLLLATPLTVCLVVLGNYVTSLSFLSTLMADEPPLSASQGFYQRLLARDTSEAVEIIERHVKTAEPRSVYDA